MRWLAVATLVVVACGDDRVGPDHNPDSTSPSSGECKVACTCDQTTACDDSCDCDPECGCVWTPRCDPDRRVGVYRLVYTELDGTCGRLNTETVRLGGAAPPGSDTCDVTQAVRNQGCTLETGAVCHFPDGTTLITSGETTQVDSAAGRIRGTILMEFTKGRSRCQSLYEVNYRRLSL